ncbi:MAG: serine acetyltransferase, partial [Clostridia bacterium]|nr:serine acetyltransferase [Clostridia bacterium]
MNNKTEKLITEILDSYKKYDITDKPDSENMLSRDTIIEVIKELRKILYPGFFDDGKARSEYIKFIVGERVEF